MKVRGTDFVLYEVSDLARSIAFYRDNLGLTLTENLEEYGWAELQAGPLTLALFDPAKMRTEAPEPRVGGAAVFLAVQGVREAVEELRGKGVKVLMEFMETPVCCQAIVADPDGNVIGLHERRDGSFG
ncbi:MAG: VOC family protein [Candidatus Latescibacterota bacterium]